MNFMDIFPFLCLVLVLILVALLLTRSNKFGKKKRREEDNRRHEFALQFAECVSSKDRDKVSGIWLFEFEEEVIPNVWFVSQVARDLLSQPNNNLVVQFGNDGTCQIGVLNASKNIFYATQSNPLLDDDELHNMKNDLSLKSKKYLVAPYHVYEVLEHKYVSIYENDSEEENWVPCKYTYVLDNNKLYVPLEPNSEKTLYVPFVHISDEINSNSY